MSKRFQGEWLGTIMKIEYSMYFFMLPFLYIEWQRSGVVTTYQQAEKNCSVTTDILENPEIKHLMGVYKVDGHGIVTLTQRENFHSVYLLKDGTLSHCTPH